MVLVDTSVWVEFFRSGTREPLEKLMDVEGIVTCLPVVQEVLQGIRDERAFQLVREALVALPVVESPMSATLFDEAVGLCRSARRAGLTVRSSVDCLIAACAVRHGLTVLHHDRDFAALARISPLKERPYHAGS